MTDAPKSSNTAFGALGLVILSLAGCLICNYLSVSNMGILGLFPVLTILGLLQSVRAVRIAEEEQEPPVLGKISFLIGIAAAAANVWLFV